MVASISTIHGGRAPDEPSVVIVNELARLLDEAKSGRLIGIAIMMLSHRYSAALLEPR